MRHERHNQSLNAIESAAKRHIGGDHYLIIVWDGPVILDSHRAASFVSDAPVGDVKLICKAVAEQIKDARN